MTVRVDIKPTLLVWARERAGVDRDDLRERFPDLDDWEGGQLSPTLKQLERYSRATHTAIGYLLLDAPPAESVPIADYRTRRPGGVERPSADLLETIFQCQLRQDWYHEFAELEGDEPLPFVGSLTIDDAIEEAASAMREELGFEVDQRGPTWTTALRSLVDRAEAAGILVMLNSVVGNDPHRGLDPQEFGGFALSDNLAPLVFVNAADTKAAQIFTLAHELAHIWLGETALSDVTIAVTPDPSVEQWCNRVAAEFLVPLSNLQEQVNTQFQLTAELDRLARIFKASTLVVLGRLRDAGYIESDRYPEVYAAELARVLGIIEEREERPQETGGGNFYATLPLRVSRRFSSALVASTLEGRTSHRDALRMLGLRKLSTFDRFSRELGIR